MTAIDPGDCPSQLSARRSLLSYLLTAATVCFVLLGQGDLIRMEPIIALGARHMRESGDWFVPRLYGQVYAFKPALAYWLAAMAEWAGGRSEFALRAPTAMCGLLLGLLIQQTLAKTVSPRCGLTGGLLAVTSILFIEQARMVGFDMPLALGVGAATLAACRNLAAGRSDLRWWSLGYAGLLFGFLAKGLPAVLLYAPGLGLAALLLGRNRMLIGWRHLLGASIFVAGAVLYVYMAYWEAGASAWAQHIDEIRSRSSSWTLDRFVATLGKPVVVFVGFLPGSALTLFFLKRQSWSRLPPGCSRLAVATAAFLATGLVMLMLTPAANPRYLLPLATPSALLAALALETCALRPPQNRPVVWAVLAGLLIWSVYVCGVEPRRAATKSLRGVAAALAPQLPVGETVFVDFGDSYSSLVFYLDCRSETRPIRAVPPERPAYFLLVNDQIDLFSAKHGGIVRRLAEQQGATGARFVLAVASSDPASAPTRPESAAISAGSPGGQNAAN